MQSEEEKRRKGRERMRRWRAADPERAYQAALKWRKANMRKVADTSARWRERNPLAAAAQNASRIYIGNTYVGTFTTEKDTNGKGNGS